MFQIKLDERFFNIDLNIPDQGKFKSMGLGEVTSLSIFEPNSDVFHKDGLFSYTIFGELGTKTRLVRPGYIDFKVKILHPMIYNAIVDLGKRYEGIMSGSVKAKFNQVTKDFEVDPNGETGYSFFLKHIDEIKYTPNESIGRDVNIELVNKYGRSNGLLSEWLVWPAGLRDYTIDSKGNPTEDEINKIYRVLIGLANRLKKVELNEYSLQLLDPVVYKVQKTVNSIYKYLFTLIDGKNKFIQSKWASRGCDYATANVITSLPTKITDLNEIRNSEFDIPKSNSTLCGIYQYLKALGPIVYNKVMTKYISRIIGTNDLKVNLINPKTMKNEYVALSTKERNNWTTLEGINNIVNKLSQDVIKNEPVLIEKHLLGIVVKSKNPENDYDNINVYFNVEDIPEEYKTKLDLVKECVENHEVKDYDIRPLSYVELFYLAVVECVPLYPTLNVRYPITGEGSIYPAIPYLKTTIKGRRSVCNIGGDGEIAVSEYPILGEPYFRSQAVHYSHTDKLGADHDGDTCSFTLLFSKEAVEEAKNYMNSKEYFIDSLGNLNYSASTWVLDITIQHLTEE